ncbi:hypothetical protein V9T40_014232 [Parthenolecanium corni]|uniref:Uncharacterized protein n=1 Tax=Parthenolecanium corni TaxID=536013 RepID=A0AAN9TGA8_9HEMI
MAAALLRISLFSSHVIRKWGISERDSLFRGHMGYKPAASGDQGQGHNAHVIRKWGISERDSLFRGHMGYKPAASGDQGQGHNAY